MKLPQVDNTISLCENHLATANCKGSQIDLFLASYLAVHIHSAFEQEIERMIESRASHVGDPVLRQFMVSCTDAIFRSTKISEIAGLLNRFGAEYKVLFHAEMTKDARASNSWDSIVSHRHGIAHDSGTQVFIHEIVEYYDHGHVVLDAFKTAIDATKAIQVAGTPPVAAAPVAAAPVAATPVAATPVVATPANAPQCAHDQP
jgi:hypothetical protein